MQKTLVTLAVLTLGALSVASAPWIADICNDRKYSLRILQSIDLLQVSPAGYPETNKIVGTLRPGERVTVRRMRYGKDFRAWLVEGEDGQTGWFVEDGNVDVFRSSEREKVQPGK